MSENGTPPSPHSVHLLAWSRPGAFEEINVTHGAGVSVAHMLVASDALRVVAGTVPDWDGQVAAGTPEVGPGFVLDGHEFPGDHMIVVVEINHRLEPRVILGCGTPVTPGMLSVAAHLLLIMARYPISQSVAARAAQRTPIVVPATGAPRMQA
jgi:hypothetical protein